MRSAAVSGYVSVGGSGGRSPPVRGIRRACSPPPAVGAASRSASSTERSERSERVSVETSDVVADGQAPGGVVARHREVHRHGQ